MERRLSPEQAFAVSVLISAAMWTFLAALVFAVYVFAL